MKTILRNFIVTIRRFKLAASLNLFGLSIAFASMLIIMFQLSYELNFNKTLKDYDNIYRVELSDDSISSTQILARPAIDIIKESAPEIKATSLLTCDNSKLIINREQFNSRMCYVYSDFFKIFEQEIVAGDISKFGEPNVMFISESFAKKIYGNSLDAIGESVKNLDERFLFDSLDYVIGGVYKDFTKNSQFGDNPVICIVDKELNVNEWGNKNYITYITVVDGTDINELEKKICSALEGKGPEWNITKRIMLRPIEELYFYKDSIVMNFEQKGNFMLSMVLIIVVVLVVVVASINFINFSTSLIPLRVKSINTQKVLGAPQSLLRGALMLESVIICVVAYLISLLIIYFMQHNLDNSIFIVPLDLAGNLDVVIIFIFVAVAIGIIAGLYPAIATTSFKPALVLNGSFGASAEGRRMRLILVALQFFVSIILIISAVVMQLQSGFFFKYDNGLNSENILAFKLPVNFALKNQANFIEDLKRSPQIVDVTSANASVGLADGYMTWGRKTKDGVNVNFTCIPVASNFIEFMGLEIVDGRGFLKDDEQKNGTYIFNEEFVRQFEIPVGSKVEGHNSSDVEVVGIVKNFNFKSLRYNIESLGLYQFGAEAWSPLTYTYVKAGGDAFDAIKVINEVYKKYESVASLDIEFYDKGIEKLYKTELNLIFMITLCSVIAVLISLIGVFGLVVFETQYRRKEIGLRKVHGATVSQVLVMYNRRFIKIILICFVFAAPIGWYFMKTWLNNFIQKTPIYWWVFVLALGLVLLVSVLTVTIQSWRSATENPVKSIKGE